MRATSSSSVTSPRIARANSSARLWPPDDEPYFAAASSSSSSASSRRLRRSANHATSTAPSTSSSDDSAVRSADGARPLVAQLLVGRPAVVLGVGMQPPDGVGEAGPCERRLDVARPLRGVAGELAQPPVTHASAPHRLAEALRRVLLAGHRGGEHVAEDRGAPFPVARPAAHEPVLAERCERCDQHVEAAGPVQREDRARRRRRRLAARQLDRDDALADALHDRADAVGGGKLFATARGAQPPQRRELPSAPARPDEMVDEVRLGRGCRAPARARRHRRAGVAGAVRWRADARAPRPRWSA